MGFHGAGEDNKGLIRVDPLQKLHTLHNLAELLGPNGDQIQGVPRTLRDSTLTRDADVIRNEYALTGPQACVLR